MAQLVLMLLVFTHSVPAQGYSPESPEVQAMLERAMKFLDARSQPFPNLAALRAYVYLKSDQTDHPAIETGLASALQFASKSQEALIREPTSYELSIDIIFLSELDAYKHQGPLTNLMTSLWKRQKSHGGFGYTGKETGDTSMTQYIVLAVWTAFHHNPELPIDFQAVRKVSEWLMRTQDPSGAWGYQGQDPGSQAGRVPQQEVRPSLSAGGLGSLYMCAELLGAGKRMRSATLSKELPAAFVPVVPVGPNPSTDGRQAGAVLTSTLVSQLKRSIVDGNKYFQQSFAIPVAEYNYYYLYALERYKSFAESMQFGDNVNPEWYDAGVDWLMTTQQPDGSWKGRNGAIAETCFASMFLLRSTEKSIQTAGDGLLVGGKGIPRDISNARVRRGQLITEPPQGSPDELLSILEDPENPDFDALVDNPQSVMLSADAGEQSGQLQRLHRLVRTGNTVARRTAVKALSKQRRLDNVPVLIAALGDEDDEVVNNARDALRFISRKFDGFGLPLNPTPEQRQKAIVDWQHWYRSVQPGAE